MAGLAAADKTEADKAEAARDRIEHLVDIGTALSAEDDTDALLERILVGARTLTGADAGTVYRVGDDGHLHFETVHNDTLGLRLGGTTGQPVTFPPLPLYREDGSPNNANVAAWVALNGDAVRIADAYDAEGFDFSGTRRIDAQTGYRSKSFLTIPMKNHESSVIGVLQLINATDPETAEVTEFSAADQRLAVSLASQAATALTKKELIDAQRNLFESFTKVLAKSIDRKNPATGGHCERVPKLTMMIADAACETRQGPLATYGLSADEYDELSVAAWLHDCGKVTTPEAVINKGTKLERQADGIDEVLTRAAALKHEQEAAMLREQLDCLRNGDEEGAREVRTRYEAFCETLEDDLDFLRATNLGGEFMRDEDLARIDAIAERYHWTDAHGEAQRLLSEAEVDNLKIRRGTLNDEEMQIMRDHVTVTREMLDELTFPRNLQRVPEIAWQHHERMDGKGYPQGITGDQMSIRARMMCLADVFEALTAADRPYKPGKKLSEALRIMGFMTQEGHFDPQLFDLFIREKVYLRYAEQFMAPELIDEIDETAIPGYEP